jgi:hypothetical protein
VRDSAAYAQLADFGAITPQHAQRLEYALVEIPAPTAPIVGVYRTLAGDEICIHADQLAHARLQCRSVS